MTPEQRDHLLSIYAVEREDDHSALLLGFSMATAAFTYMIAATVYVYNLYGDCTRGGASQPRVLCEHLTLIQVLAPAVPVAVVGYMALNTAAARMRSVHLQWLEKVLKEQLTTDGRGKPIFSPSFHTDAGIVWRPDSPWRENFLVHLVFTSISIIVYTIINGGLVLFTLVVLSVGGWTGNVTGVDWIGKKGFAVVYGVVELLEIVGFLVPVFNSRFKYRKSFRKKPRKKLAARRRRGILYYLW